MKEMVEGDVFYSDPDLENEIQVGKNQGCVQDDYLFPILEKFIGKRVRVIVEEIQ